MKSLRTSAFQGKLPASQFKQKWLREAWANQQECDAEGCRNHQRALLTRSEIAEVLVRTREHVMYFADVNMMLNYSYIRRKAFSITNETNIFLLNFWTSIISKCINITGKGRERDLCLMVWKFLLCEAFWGQNSNEKSTPYLPKQLVLQSQPGNHPSQYSNRCQEQI